MLASVLVDEVATILNDMQPGYEHTRWPVPELLNYLSEAINAIVGAKPSLFSTVVQISLAPGSTQRLPDEYSKLIDIHFNINSDGSEGPNVLPGVYALQQAFQKPDCPSNALVEVYSAYPGSDRFFWVDPPIPRGMTYIPKVEALVMLAPQPITSASQPVLFPGSSTQLYQGALVDWMLYRCFAKDMESATSAENAQAHLKAFQSYLGISVVASPSAAKKSSGNPAQARAA